jgi:hypothetical protein
VRQWSSSAGDLAQAVLIGHGSARIPHATILMNEMPAAATSRLMAIALRWPRLRRLYSYFGIRRAPPTYLVSTSTRRRERGP